MDGYLPTKIPGLCARKPHDPRVEQLHTRSPFLHEIRQVGNNRQRPGNCLFDDPFVDHVQSVRVHSFVKAEDTPLIQLAEERIQRIFPASHAVIREFSFCIFFMNTSFVYFAVFFAAIRFLSNCSPALPNLLCSTSSLYTILSGRNTRREVAASMQILQFRSMHL